MSHPWNLTHIRVAHPLRSLQRVGIPESELLGIFLSRFRPCATAPALRLSSMPTGLKRYYGNDHLHFLTCTCYHRQPWLHEARNRDLFLRIFDEERQRYGFVVVGYVVMPEPGAPFLARSVREKWGSPRGRNFIDR